MSPHNAAICTTISYTLGVEWYYLKNNYLTLRSKVKVPRRSLQCVTHCLMVMHPHTKYHWPISKDNNVMAWTRKYYLKNNYLTSRSKVKVPRRSIQYATHRLMVMHPHTKYHWPIWKDKKVMVRTSFAEKKRKKRKKKSHWNNMSPFVWRGDIITITNVMCWSSLLCDPVSLLAVIATTSDVVSSHDRRDLIQIYVKCWMV
jgi:hypothetical protein